MIPVLLNGAPPTGRVFRFGGTCYFACGGMIKVVQEKSGLEATFSTTDFAERIRTMAKMLKYKDHDAHDDALQADARKRVKNLCKDASECIQEATFQGDPTLAKTREHWTKHSPLARLVPASDLNRPVKLKTLAEVSGKPVGKIPGNLRSLLAPLVAEVAKQDAAKKQKLGGS